MLYKKNGTKCLDEALFKDPTAEYRATPFWAWNCVLDKDLLLRQIDCFKEMGFGGFHMHTRAGMGTKYLSEEFMSLIKACRDKAEEKEMLAWLYDEDRWPSGTAGGYVTKTKKYRQKILVFSEKKVDFVSKDEGVKEGKPYLLAAYDILLDEKGFLKSYRVIGEDEAAEGVKRYAYVTTAKESGWFNDQTYVDTLSPEAMAEFIRITYEAYDRAVGESFDGSIPAIFTDEPQTARKSVLPFALGHGDVTMPFTTDFSETFLAAYGVDLIARLPEVFWDRADGKKSKVRYFFHDHVCERFTESFSDQCGGWCDAHGIALMGHMMEEPTLGSQTGAIGEAMRAYRSFAIPGIDMLCDAVQLTTAKQAQSAKNQYGREAMMSELYGVTGWNFDFRGHKFQGDWQAALGVTVRVPHLAWVSMKGSAKRDYPASIGCQAPWYKDYSYVENHFARLNTVLTRGKPLVKVGVIHPIESYWINYGPNDTSSEARGRLEGNFDSITRTLIDGMVDFDFICESLLPSQCGEIGKTLTVGKMRYETVLVPGCETLRRTTLDVLKEFAAKGGRVVFLGDAPRYVDALESDEPAALCAACERVPFERVPILKALEGERTAELINGMGSRVSGYVHTMREDGDVKWFFLAHATHKDGRRMGGLSRYDNMRTMENNPSEGLRIVFSGNYIPTVYDTMSGKTYTPRYETKNGKTTVYRVMHEHDSLLLCLKEGEGRAEAAAESTVLARFDFRHGVPYEREEENVYMLDMAEYSVEGEPFADVEEILRIDRICRDRYRFPLADGKDCQPWAIEGDEDTREVRLRFTVRSETAVEGCFVAAEEALAISFNGKAVSLSPCGYYVDESIKKYPIGRVEKGENVLEITAPIGKRISIENFFLLGDFDVMLRGCEQTVVAPKRTIGFGDSANQGLAFYGGNIIYKTKVTTPAGRLRVQIPRYRGAAVRVALDGKEMGHVAFAPYMLDLGQVEAGEHTVTFTLLGSRVNTFSALHNASADVWYGPAIWYTGDRRRPDGENAAAWSYEYVLEQTGILSSPILEILDK